MTSSPACPTEAGPYIALSFHTTGTGFLSDDRNNPDTGLYFQNTRTGVFFRRHYLPLCAKIYCATRPPTSASQQAQRKHDANAAATANGLSLDRQSLGSISPTEFY